jgi:hypothetical protein
MSYTIIDKTTHRVTHLNASAEEVRVMSGVLFIPSDECVGTLGQKFDPNTGLFHDFILSVAEFQKQHAEIFRESDIVVLRHLEGSQALTDTQYDQWKAYRATLRAIYHSYEPVVNFEWPAMPS